MVLLEADGADVPVCKPARLAASRGDALAVLEPPADLHAIMVRRPLGRGRPGRAVSGRPGALAVLGPPALGLVVLPALATARLGMPALAD
eukprot:15305191-Heterocapsa_arctica.AAC.1